MNVHFTSCMDTTRGLQLACQHIDSTVNNWMNVICSDETKVNRFGSDGKSYAWKVPGKPLKKHQVRETMKHGGCSKWCGAVVAGMTQAILWMWASA